jgi:elongation factor G
LRVLDGAVLVLCGVAGVQSQSMTVDHQMRRYRVPRLAFLNKLDRSGANPQRVTEQLCEKLGHNAVLMQLPIGLEADFRGVVDLVTMKAVYFEGGNGEHLLEKEIPAELREEAEVAREKMLDVVSMFSDELMEAILGDSVTEELVQEAVRAGTLSMELTPVFLGSAYKNKGVQKLLDAVIAYLPGPADVENTAVDLSNDETPIALEPCPNKPLVAVGFKLEDGRYGQLTYVRVYQGALKKGMSIVNSRTGRKHRVGRLVRMHADSMEDIRDSTAGDIVALFGIECASGDTFSDGSIQVAMSSIHVPEPVISLSVKPVDKNAQDSMSKALGRFVREDPTFRAGVDRDSGETVISGMGELHLEVYVERMKREYDCEVETGAPQVAYRETVSQRAEFNYTQVRGGAIPTEYIPSVEKGFVSSLEKGRLTGFPVQGVRVVVNDGKAHSVDSSDNAFRAAARGAFRQVYAKAKPIILEPVMKLEPRRGGGAARRDVRLRHGAALGDPG